jgi:hypothetical protein
MRKGNSQRGYAFLIVAIAIFIVAMLGITVLADYAIKTEQRKTDSTRLARVYRAIVGDPSTDTFGYLGDVGSYPTTFQDLLQSPGATGWNGPYLGEDLFNGSTVNDSYGSAMEYDLNLTAGSPDELAIISKGPDHSSSNGASNPNDRTQFTGSRPSSGATYTSASGNSDNLAYPDYSVSPASALQYNPTGTLAYNLVNSDINQAKAVVPACPLEYNIVATSHTRPSDTITLPWGPGLADNFLQGLWDVSITSAQALSSYFSESVAMYSGRTVNHRVRVEDIDSSKTPTFNLYIDNNTAVPLDIYQFATKKGSNIASGAQNVLAAVLNVCGTMTSKNHNTNAVIDTWVMPWGTNDTHVVSTTLNSVTITNGNGASPYLQVYGNDGLLMGTVYQRQTVVFNNIEQGAPIVVTDQAALNILGNFTMGGAGTSHTY